MDGEGRSGRVAVVTGAGGGIGLAACACAAGGGLRVVGADIDLGELADLPRDGSVHGVQADLRKVDAADGVIAAAVEVFGRIDILVNNASVASVRKGFLETSDDDWQATLELNLLGYVRAARAAIPAMRRSGAGVLIHSHPRRRGCRTPDCPTTACRRPAY